MSEQGDAGQQRQVQLRIDESKRHSAYANTIRTSTTQDEVVLDFGMNLPVQDPQSQQAMLLFSVESRVIMNWSSAKRLAISLGQVIRQHEERNGEIVIQRPQPAPAPGGDTPGGPQLAE